MRLALRASGIGRLASLALLGVPACMFPRPVDAPDFTPNPYSRTSPPLPTTAKLNRPPPHWETPANKVEPVKYQPVAEPPQSVPATLEPSLPVVELRPTVPVIEPPDSPLVEAVKDLQRQSPETAAQKFASLDRPSRELLASMLPLVVRVADGTVAKADPQDIAALIEQVNAAIAPLRNRAAMEVPKLCFCRPVGAPARFGSYERLDENHCFKPGETVAVYLELRNFSCAPRDGDFETHVKTTVEVRDAADRVVFRFDSDRADPSLSPRNDYCHVGRFTLPQLPAGAYTLWLKAIDVPTGRAARRSLNFRVASLRGPQG